MSVLPMVAIIFSSFALAVNSYYLGRNRFKLHVHEAIMRALDKTNAADLHAPGRMEAIREIIDDVFKDDGEG